jgi:hypothetical protein
MCLPTNNASIPLRKQMVPALANKINTGNLPIKQITVITWYSKQKNRIVKGNKHFKWIL